MEYEPLGLFLAQTDELKKLILEYPDYPIIVTCDSEVVADEGYAWWYAPKVHFSLGEILDCKQDINDEKIYVDKDEFKEDISDKLCWKEEYQLLPDDAFDKIVDEKFKEYEPYWKPVIMIHATI